VTVVRADGSTESRSAVAKIGMKVVGEDQVVDRRRRLQIVLGLVGTTACVAGASGVLTGARGVLVPGSRTRSPGDEVVGRSSAAAEDLVSPEVDSELRFFAAWYCVGGLTMLRAAAHPDTSGAAVQITAAGWLLAALGRVLSVRQKGRPHAIYLALTGLEFAIPAVLVAWQRQVQRQVRLSQR
jgi:hypothetical protein